MEIPLVTVMDANHLDIRYEVHDYLSWGSTFKKMVTFTKSDNLPNRVERFRDGKWEEIYPGTYWDVRSCVWQFAFDMAGFKCRVKHRSGYKTALLQWYESVTILDNPPANYG